MILYLPGNPFQGARMFAGFKSWMEATPRYPLNAEVAGSFPGGYFIIHKYMPRILLLSLPHKF